MRAAGERSAEDKDATRAAGGQSIFAIGRIEIAAIAEAGDIFFLTIDPCVTLVQHRTLRFVHFSLDFVFQ